MEFPLRRHQGRIYSVLIKTHETCLHFSALIKSPGDGMLCFYCTQHNSVLSLDVLMDKQKFFSLHYKTMLHVSRL